MISRHFFAWARTASAGERAEGVASLAQDYIYMVLTPDERRQVEGILTVMLEDSSPLVRRAMAESLARQAAAPHHIIMGLAADQPEIAAIVLGRSPVLGDEELIDCVAMAGPVAQAAVAQRPELSAAVGAALTEVGSLEAVIALAANAGAKMTEASLLRMIERFGSEGPIREALLGRPHLPASVRAELAVATGDALATFATSVGWLSAERGERVVREAREKVMVSIAADAADEAGRASLMFARHLRHSRHLTAALLLRALLSIDRSLFEAAMCELSGLPFAKVAALVGHSQSPAFNALYTRAGLPGWLLPAIRGALAAQAVLDEPCDERGGARLLRPLVDATLRVCSGMNTPETGKLVALLRRFEAEAARDEVRGLAAAAVCARAPRVSGLILDMRPTNDVRIAA
jgi:uncharacterized protein (DUF2336 family)